MIISYVRELPIAFVWCSPTVLHGVGEFKYEMPSGSVLSKKRLQQDHIDDIYKQKVSVFISHLAEWNLTPIKLNCLFYVG